MYNNKMSLVSIVLKFVAITYLFAGSIKCDEGIAHSRPKRVPFYTGTGLGYIVALAQPIALGKRHAFTAVNFEIHFALADNNTFSPTGLINRFQGKRSIRDDAPIGLPTEPIETSRRNNKFTRKNVYRVIENQMFGNGYNGTACLLKTICNTAESELYENNGVFGNLFHIIFTPSSSEDEHIPQMFYDAEEMGKWGHCDRFDHKCPKSLLEIVSQTMDEVMNKIRR